MENRAIRHKLEHTRSGITHKAEIDGSDLYITISTYADGKVGEIFLHMGKVGSTMRGLLDLLGLQSSLLLQYGMPLDELCNKMIGVSFEPKGRTNNKDIPNASSICDYAFRWLKAHYVDKEQDK